jgi:oxygen-independent coproporphyrinogen-3 oxidase
LAKCPYCDFVSYVEPAIDHAGYASAVLRELDVRAPAFERRRIQSIFFGGGTPSLWDSNELGRVLAGVRAALETCRELEVTVECNPTSLDEGKARALADVGVNRLSIGVQSLDDQRLRFLGRLHDARGAVAAVSGALRSGIQRVSADLIFGLAGQTPADARDEAEALVDLGLSHVSAYQLTIEAGTRFGELARRGRLPMAEDAAVADSFAAIDEIMANRGMRHYEVSNYARPGDEARHNLGYWHGDEYLGLGCGAYGFVRETREKGAEPPSRGAQGIRWRNIVNPERYADATRSTPRRAAVEAVEANGVEESREALDAQTLLRERIMLGLRIAEGIDLERAGQDLGAPGWTEERVHAVAKLEKRGRIVREGSRVRIPPGAWLWTDDTSARLF